MENTFTLNTKYFGIKLTALFIALLLFSGQAWAATYYSQGSVAPHTTTNWNTNRAGGSSTPSNFTAGDIFVIQNGHNMTTSATWSVSGTGSKIQIESGGTLTAAAVFAVTVASATTFQIDAGGKYVHSNTVAFASTIFTGTESFAANSTVEFTDWNSAGPAVTTFGNLKINPTGQPASALQLGGSTTTINGNLEVLASGTTTVRDLRLSASTAFTLTISGDLIVSGTGSLDIASSAGSSVARTINIGGSYNQTGGTVKCTGTSNAATINFTGTGKTFTQSAGTLTNTNINWSIANGASLTLANDLPVATGRTLTVGAGTSGILDCSTLAVSGAGTITTSAGSTLKTAHASGINGNLTVTTKNLNAATNYTFTGSVDQVTGALITNAKNITLANTSGKVSLSNSIAITGTLVIPTGNKLDAASYVVSGAGDIDLQSGGTFLTAHTSGLNGNNTTSGGLSSYSTTANYTFNGSSAQVTGSFMPATVNNFTASNSAGVSLSAGATVSGTLLLSSGKLTIGANTLTLAGAFSGSAANSLTGSATSNVSISGTPGTVYFDQTTLGTSNVLKNLSISGSGTTTLGNTLNITGGTSFGVVTVGGTATLASAGNLILKSTSTGTAAIGNSSGTITGNITVERFISGSGRKWRYLSSPVTGQTLANWGSQFYITGPGTPGATVGSQNTNGYATTRSNLLGFNNIAGTPASVRTYNRTTSGTMENAWANPTTDMSTTLTPGVGYRAFVRGPITGDYATDTVVIGYYNTSGAAPSQAALTLSQTGGVSNGVNAGSVVITINSTGTGTASAFDATNDGWNLIGNPYPCAFDWGAFWTANANRTNIVNSIYIYDVTASSYKSYNGSALSGSLNNGLIPSSTSFFIQASASGAALTFTEAFKSTSAPSALHKNSLSDELHITYYKDSTESDEYILKMMEGATLENDMYDIKKLKNVNLNLSSYGTDSINLTLSSIPFVTDETRISLNVEATQIGTYKFDFNTIETFDKNKSVNLLDKFTGETIDIRKNPIYTFEMDAAPHQWGNDRFVLIFKAISTSGMVDMNANSILNTKVSVYPNPATDVLNVNINNASFKNSSVSIFNISGTELLSSNMVGTSSQFNIESLSSGVYFVKIRNSNGFDKTVKFIK